MTGWRGGFAGGTPALPGMRSLDSSFRENDGVEGGNGRGGGGDVRRCGRDARAPIDSSMKKASPLRLGRGGAFVCGWVGACALALARSPLARERGGLRGLVVGRYGTMTPGLVAYTQ